MVGLASFVVIAASFADAAPTKVDAFEQTVRPFLETYCAACHSDRRPKAGIDLVSLPNHFEDFNTASQWQKALEQMQGGVMPPVT